MTGISELVWGARPLRPDERRDYDGLSERTMGDGKKAFRDWAACMKAKGVRAYRTPNEPYQDKRWADRDGARGVRTAVASAAGHRS